MHLNQLWVFYHVAKHKSFSQAAEALFLTQPSVSNQVKVLEEAYELKLFERFGRTIGLTHPGEVLYAYAERIFTLAKEADSIIGEFKGLKGGVIKISAGSTLGAYYLPDIIECFRKKHPLVEIRMTAGYTQTVLEDILASRSDLGLIGQAVHHPNIVATPLWEEELVLIVASDHPFARMKEIDISRLQDQPFIMSERGSGVRTITEGLFRQTGISPPIAMELGENEAVKRAVASGQGITIISARVARGELEAGTLRAIRLAGERLIRPFYIIHHKDKYLSRLIGAFMEEVLSHPASGEAPQPRRTAHRCKKRPSRPQPHSAQRKE
jgi:DNA-binding transcriptional LysR family regulator